MDPMILEHQGKRPQIHETATIAPNATISGDVRIGAHCRVLFGAVLTSEDRPLVLGTGSIVMENAVIRASGTHAVTVGNAVLVGPQAMLSGCTIDDCAYISTGGVVYNGARIGSRSWIRAHGVVQVNTFLRPESVVPTGYVAIGDPAEILAPSDQARISQLMAALNFPKTVFGIDFAPSGETILPEICGRYGAALAAHKDDKLV
jgi:carbonic anhydrase/acetyltransferase-like protein (isoleucine patch superfamily)